MFDDFDTQQQIEEFINEEMYYMNNYKVGDKIRIIYMADEPKYTGREGTIRSIDDMGQLHGSWGGLAVIPGEDCFEIITE